MSSNDEATRSASDISATNARSGGGHASSPLPPEPVDVEDLRHPTEPSRFGVAVLSAGIAVGVFVFVTIAAVGPLAFTLMVILLMGFLALIWLLLQLLRVRLLGAAIRVSAATFPELQEAVDEVRARLDYWRRVDIYVVESQAPPLVLTSYFGIRSLLIEGNAVADLTASKTRPQLIYLLSSHLGQLKARHARWQPALFILQLLGLTKVLNPFINAWYRAAALTGDQLAYVCCRELSVGLQALQRLLVGKEMAPQLRADGVVEQAIIVRKSKLLRLSQLLMPHPHPTNRYLNLLAFASQRDTDGVDAFKRSLSASTLEALDSTLPRVRRPPTREMPAQLALGVAAVILSASVPAGWAAYEFGAVDIPSDLQALHSDCDGGDMAACDALYLESPVGSSEEKFGSSCGDRSEPAAGQCAEQQGSTNLERLYNACDVGDMDACNSLYSNSMAGSAYEYFGSTCGHTRPSMYGNC